MKKEKVNRSYVLRLYGSQAKFEDLKWSAYQYTKLANAFINHLYFKKDVKYFSTEGFGVLGNQSQQKALGIVKSKRTNEEENGHKKSVPRLSVQTCFANIKNKTHQLILIIELILDWHLLMKDLNLDISLPKELNH